MSAACKRAADGAAPGQAAATDIELLGFDPGVFDSASAMNLLFRKARPSLTRAELVWLADDGSSAAEALARRAAVVAAGIGCLVAEDGKSASGFGNFQAHDDVPALLFHLASVFEQIEGLVNVSSQAAADLREGGAT